MVLPPPQRLWVGMLAVMIMLLEFPGALHKCIFDEVQAQSRVVRAADSPPNEPRLRARAGRRTHHPGWRSSPPRGLTLRPTPASPQPIRIRSWIARESSNLSEAERRRLEAAVEEAVRTVSSSLSGEKQTRHTCIYTQYHEPSQAVHLSSVNRAQGPLLLSRDVNKYCKFLWRNSSTANYNRCVRQTWRPEVNPFLKTECEYQLEFSFIRCGRANNNYRSETCLDVTVSITLNCFASHERVLAVKLKICPSSFGRSCHQQIPDDHLAGCDIYPEADSPRRTELRAEGAGVPDTDFLLYLHVQDTDKCRAEPVLAYAVHCQTDVHGRPVAGVVVICRDRLTEARYSHQAAVQDAPPGRASSHWESRVLRGSIMTAVLEDSSAVRIDPVTLAALQDTGWYTVNLSQAQSLVWGDGEGAVFGSLSTCRDRSSCFFCTGSGFGCHYLHLHKAECQTDQYLEGCRVYKPLKNGSECWREENNRRTAEEDRSGEIFGFDSRCFFSSLTRRVSVQQNDGGSAEGRCYRHRCAGPNRYQIKVSGSEWVDCPAGGTIQVKGYRGLVSCPDRRLCLYPDVAPPSDDVFPASISDQTSVQNGTWSLLCIPAAVCLLAAFMVSYRKCRSCRIRIHAGPE
ncbi:Leishmanolysin-like peptidase [Nibea albiflora]|uniref:Leishmanolysin-like peptidase n=1 Tax=Nibea albiflora TaxID=240163 RepID=A0ACB7EW73_NIBAL|nr:Leishmanolysin-like peptidase [Nibea albiflora]